MDMTSVLSGALKLGSVELRIRNAGAGSRGRCHVRYGWPGQAYFRLPERFARIAPGKALS